MLNIKNQILKFMNAIFSVIQILISKKKYFINKNNVLMFYTLDFFNNSYLCFVRGKIYLEI